eukprot:gene3352-4203_t
MEPTNNDSQFTIKAATPQDIQTVFDLIIELSEYEKLRHMVIGTVDDLRKWTQGEEKAAHIYCGWVNGKIVAYTLHFLNFSTFLCAPGIYLEDIYVQPEHRGKGYGKKLILHLCKIAKEKGFGRVEWQVLDWNKPSIDFYESLGAKPMNGWTQYRLVGEPLLARAQEFDTFPTK